MSLGNIFFFFRRFPHANCPEEFSFSLNLLSTSSLLSEVASSSRGSQLLLLVKRLLQSSNSSLILVVDDALHEPHDDEHDVKPQDDVVEDELLGVDGL
jgi:hypothetical protein